jgi:hypothetical protein
MSGEEQLDIKYVQDFFNKIKINNSANNMQIKEALDEFVNKLKSENEKKNAIRKEVIKIQNIETFDDFEKNLELKIYMYKMLIKLQDDYGGESDSEKNFTPMNMDVSRELLETLKDFLDISNDEEKPNFAEYLQSFLSESINKLIRKIEHIDEYNELKKKIEDGEKLKIKEEEEERRQITKATNSRAAINAIAAARATTATTARATTARATTAFDYLKAINIKLDKDKEELQDKEKLTTYLRFVDEKLSDRIRENITYLKKELKELKELNKIIGGVRKRRIIKPTKPTKPKTPTKPKPTKPKPKPTKPKPTKSKPTKPKPTKPKTPTKPKKPTKPTKPKTPTKPKKPVKSAIVRKTK